MKGVPNLPAVPLLLAWVALEIPSRVVENVTVVNVDPRSVLSVSVHGESVALCLYHSQLSKVHFENGQCPVQSQRGVIQTQVDAGFEGFIQRADTIRRQEEDAAVVL